MTFIGISRKTIFSPNRESADAAIFQGVATEIEKRGHDVVRVSESVLTESGLPSGLSIDGIFHMVRSVEALGILNKQEAEGVPVINTPQAVMNCGRALCAGYLSSDILCFVNSLVLSTDKLPAEWNVYPCWVKRGDTQSYFADDVRFVISPKECAAVLGNFYARGVGTAVLSTHVPGRIVKFYGVSDIGFFNWRMVNLDKESKFGLEKHNDNNIIPCFDEEYFRKVCFSSAQILGLDVFGGDAVISERGRITLIDFNDWPSFSGCVHDAESRIAELIIKRALSIQV